MNERVEALLDQLTLDEQVALLAGADMWHTVAVERLGIPALRVTDGPAGARGTSFHGPASINVPCGTALAATFDPSLVEEVGRLLGRETRAKGANVLLAPTVNLHRAPIGGRNFECLSEDPYLSARIAVAYVRGVQTEGVVACIKHFVGNDTEFERMTIDARVDERTLRELYLVPFEAAVKEAAVGAVMTAYNRVNGEHAADNEPLVNGLLRGEWGFDGLVMSDWFGLHSTARGIEAGCDLEMPGPTLHRGAALVAAVERGEVAPDVVRASARRVLALLERTGVLDSTGPGPELTNDDPADRALVRRAASSAMVLLRNDSARTGTRALPIDVRSARRVAVIGPNAAQGQIMGGGSAHVTPTHVSRPLDAIRDRLGAAGIEVVHARGTDIHRRLPAIDPSWWEYAGIDYFADPAALDDPDAVPARSDRLDSTQLLVQDDPIGRDHANPEFGARLRVRMVPPVGGMWRVGIESVADTRITVDGHQVIDNADHPAGGSFFGMGRAEVSAEVELEAGRAVEIVAEMRHRATGVGLGGLNLGAAPVPLDDPIHDATAIAASSDVSIIVVGTNDDWECEGWDRDVLELPGAQDELIRRVAAVSRHVVVVVNAGSPVAMPWLHEVDAVVMAWFPGQEMGDALADLLTGDAEPQGRLPVTFPRRIEDTPAGEHHPGRNGVAHYREGRLIGHHWYDTVGRDPLFPFGFGLGYASTRIESAAVVEPGLVRAVVVNESDRDGVEVVQVYAASLGELRGDTPRQRFVGAAKVHVPAGGAVEVDVVVDPRAHLTWDADTQAWVGIDGPRELRVGRSSRDITHHLEAAS